MTACLHSNYAIGWRHYARRKNSDCGARIPRPASPEVQLTEKLEDRLARIRAVSEALTAGISH